MNSVKDFRGKIKPPVEKGVLKIERHAQKLTQGYSEYGGSYLWAPEVGQFLEFHRSLKSFFAENASFFHLRAERVQKV